MFDRILCSIDGSPVSQRIVEAAAELAANRNGTVVVLHAYHIPDEFLGLAKHYATDDHFLNEIRQKLLAEHQPIVEEAVETLQRAGVQAEPQLREQEPKLAVLEVIDEQGCDSVVLGSHGKGGVRRFLLGSVSDYVVHHAKVPVLVVKS